MDKLTEFFKKNKAVLLVLAVGVALMLLPTGARPAQAATAASEKSEEARIEAILSSCEGVGRVKVMLGERDGALSGCVIVCDGAASASVRLTVTEAVSRLTGLAFDRISVINMKGGEQ
ncbi:MAG: hypothetical protein II881_07965 [Oscillospiraceae bacterium]|nr:hypothetical protein [Oscillospiraceae bacterium]